ncbi:MAG: ABC transporter substrate-binding protein [Chloroherpetonaceae bacterium]
MTHIKKTGQLLFVLLLLLLTACWGEAIAQRKQRKVIEEETPKRSGSTLDVDKESKKQLTQSTWERRFKKGISHYENEQYAEADSLFLGCIERGENATDEQKSLALFWRTKALMQQARYAELPARYLELERNTLSDLLRAELLFDKAVLACRQQHFLDGAQQFIALIPADWTISNSENLLVSKAYRYLALLANAYLSEQDLRRLLPTIQNRAVRLLFTLRAVEHKLYHSNYDAALSDLTRFKEENPTLDSDEQKRLSDLKFQAMQLKSGIAKRLCVGVLLPATLKPFDGSGDIGASKLMIGAILAKDEANHLSQRAFVHLAVRSTSGLRPDGVVAQAKSLVEQDSVQVILGPMYSEEALAVSEYCGARGIVMLTPTATDERISALSPTSFQLNPTHRARGASMARFAIQDLHAKTAGIFAQDSTYGKDMGAGFKDTFEQLGGEVKLFALLPESFSSFSKALAPLNLTFDKQLGYPLTQFDVIYLPMTSPEAVAIALSQLRFYNIRGELLGSSDWLDERLLNNRDLITNFYYASDFQLIENSATNSVVYLYKTRFGEDPNAFFWLGYDAMDYLFRSALSPNSKPDLKLTIRSAPPIEMHHIPVFFDGKNVNQMMNIIRFSNGTMARVK